MQCPSNAQETRCARPLLNGLIDCDLSMQSGITKFDHAHPELIRVFKVAWRSVSKTFSHCLLIACVN